MAYFGETMRTLLVDNYDSYTYNLYQLSAEVTGTEPIVFRNDDPAWESLDLTSFDGAIISPGPGHPASARDFGHSLTVLQCEDLPVLGVCLGHQGIGLASGARVVSAPRPRHGHLTRVRHNGDGIFAGLPPELTGVRYHSWCVARPLPPDLEAVAWSEDDVIMGIRHRRLPRWGVQFHPESICTEYGHRLLANFRDLALQAARGRRRSARPATSPVRSCRPAAPDAPVSGAAADPVLSPAQPAQVRAYTLTIERAVDSESAFTALYGMRTRAFWLDSARVEPGMSRFSFMGDVSGPAGEVLTYNVDDGFVIVEPTGRIPWVERGTIFEALQRRVDRPVAGADSLPFDLAGGYVGYLGYELKAVCGSPNAHRSGMPDAVWLRADRFVAIDHAEGRTYVVAVAEPAAADEARTWAERTASALRGIDAPPRGHPGNADIESAWEDIAQWLVRPREQYLADIAECQRMLRAGESYEICLTNNLRMPAPADDLEFYSRLRRLNPAPYSAFLRVGEMAVLSSSPERFLRVDSTRTAEAKPIKGTTPRNADPELDELLRLSLNADAKTRAENLMIVDLMRNDLGRVCEIGSITVPKVMETESYATVHQLVSTVRGNLRADVTAIDCARACFPGGSMTGAPKLRTMEIIDTLESEARGIYSGALGYFGLTGTADLSIVIRTAVRWRDELVAGAGGAIVLDSDPVGEYDEMMLKARAALQALPASRPAYPTVTGQGVA